MRISDWSSDVCSSDLISGLSSGVNLLNSGAMTVGNSQRIRKLNSTQVPQAHQTQLGPVFPMIHKTLAARGMPRIRVTISVLRVSSTKRRGVMRLKPNRVSSLNLRQVEICKIGRVHVRTPVTTWQIVCLLLLAKQ